MGSVEEQNDVMIREFIAAWERRDAEHIVECFTDDGVYHSVPLKAWREYFDLGPAQAAYEQD